MSADADKEIDDTFSAVRVRCGRDLFGDRSVLIRRDAAVAYYLSRLLGRRVKCLSCPHCQEVHLDAGEFAIWPHRHHVCQACGRHFWDTEEAVSNPLALVREILDDTDKSRFPIRATDSLDVCLSDFPGGVQIWASNPAIVWTAPRPEQEGIHVHLFASSGEPPEPDETFRAVRLNGMHIDETMVRYMMAQRALSSVAGRIEALNCPKCSEAHFDREEKAFLPHVEHRCEHCGAVFRGPGRRRLSVSNPLVSIFDKIHPFIAPQRER